MLLLPLLPPREERVGERRFPNFFTASQSRRARRGGARTLVRSNSRTPRRAKNLYSPHSLFTLLRTKVRAPPDVTEALPTTGFSLRVLSRSVANWNNLGTNWRDTGVKRPCRGGALG